MPEMFEDAEPEQQEQQTEPVDTSKIFTNKRVYDSQSKRVKPDPPSMSVDEILKDEAPDPDSRPKTYQLPDSIKNAEYPDDELLTNFQALGQAERFTQGQHDGLIGIWESEAKTFDGDVDSLFDRHAGDIVKLGLSRLSVLALKDFVSIAIESVKRDMAYRQKRSKAVGNNLSEKLIAQIRERELSIACRRSTHPNHKKVVAELKNLYQGRKP